MRLALQSVIIFFGCGSRLHHRTFKAKEVAVGRSLVHILDGFFAAVLHLAVYRPDRGLDCRYLGSSCPYVQAPRLWQLRYSLYTVSAGHVLAHTSSYATRHTLVKYTFILSWPLRCSLYTAGGSYVSRYSLSWQVTLLIRSAFILYSALKSS